MRTYARALLLLVTLAVPLPASAAPPSSSEPVYHCTYYFWDQSVPEWVRWKMQPKEEFERTHVLGIDYHCVYACLPLPMPPPPDPGGGTALPEEVEDLVTNVEHTVSPVVQPVLEPVLEAVRDIYAQVDQVAGFDPFRGPACPPVPPPIARDAE